MRPWMKMLAVGGVVGVALSVAVAAEKPITRKLTTPAKSKPGRLEFISRGSAAAQQQAAAAQESAAPSDPTIDVVAEELAEDVMAAPKRFTRAKVELGEEGPLPQPTRTTLKPAKGTNTDKLSDAKPATRTAQAARKAIAEDVELLAPPEVAEQDEAPVARKLVAKKPASEIQPAGFVAEPKAKPDDADDEANSGIVAADYQEAPADEPKIQQTSVEQRPAPAELPVVEKKSHVSVIANRAPKPTAVVTNRAPRATAMPSRAALLKNSFTSGTPSVSVEWVKQGEINVGQECACDLVVKNTGKVPARAVVVDANFPTSVRLVNANPEPVVVDDHLEWSIPELAAGEERTIHIAMIPSQRGDLAATANVRFTGTAASIFKVEEPLLKVTTQAPTEVVVGDPLVQTVTVTNPGSGVAQNVKIQVAAPAGLEATRGDRSTIEVGSLNPGESRTVRISFTAIAGGDQTLEVAATADSGLNQVAEATVNVIAPSLAVAVEGPSVRYAGREARFTLSVTNEGKAATNNVRVSHRIPKGFKFLKADKGGTFDASTGSVNWFVGHLEAAQSAQLKLQLQATELGDFEHHVFASAEHGVTAKADTTTKVEGSAALVMEVQDQEDPVEVGHETAYEVRVSNTGSKGAMNVGLTFELPRGVELLDVQSATKHFAKSGLVLFNDLPELAPGKTAIFRIHVKGTAEGNQRVRARLTSESIDEELVTEEVTKFTAE